MNGAQNGADNAGFGPNSEGLDVMLGRFQAWAKTRREKPGYGASEGDGSGDHLKENESDGRDARALL
jgi:hypothetical protein